jgi:hypothetical protein
LQIINKFSAVFRSLKKQTHGSKVKSSKRDVGE